MSAHPSIPAYTRPYPHIIAAQVDFR
jgi:hypothetical protein